MLICRTVTPTNPTWLSNECVSIFLWPVYFCITPFRVTSSTALLLSHVYLSFHQTEHIIGGEWFLRRGKIALTLTSAARECRDVLAIHLADRLRSKYLVTFSLLHLPKFAEYNDHFLTNLLASASDFFPMISTT